jgi:hypothetical protein
MKTKIGLLGLFLSFLSIGCNKDDQTDTPMTADDLTINAYMDEMSDDVSKIAFDQYVKASSSIGKMEGIAEFLPDCAKITYTDTKDTFIRTIDFGTNGCTMGNGNKLKGKIIISGSTDYTLSTYTINCSFDNFYHNGNLIQGGKTVIRTNGSTANLETAHPILTTNDDLKVTTTNGVVRNITATRVREMVEGFDTKTIWIDDVYLISGTQSVNSPKGTITSTIKVPLKISMNCNHILQGVIDYTKKDKAAILDYGDGTCDNKATATINGVVKPILLGNN